MQRRAKHKPGKYQLHVIAVCRSLQLPVPEYEHYFYPGREWRFDLAWPEMKLACEIDGGLYSGGRHVRGKGAEDDCEKYSAAAIRGWSLMRVSTGMVRSGRVFGLIQEAIEYREKGESE